MPSVFLIIFVFNSIYTPMETVKKQLVSGALFIAVAKYSGVAINLLITAILARILVPEQFAMVAIASIVSNFFNLFCDFGFASAIIQRQDLSTQDHSNIFSFSGYLGIVLAAIFFCSSQPGGCCHGFGGNCGISFVFLPFVPGLFSW